MILHVAFIRPLTSHPYAVPGVRVIGVELTSTLSRRCVKTIALVLFPAAWCLPKCSRSISFSLIWLRPPVVGKDNTYWSEKWAGGREGGVRGIVGMLMMLSTVVTTPLTSHLQKAGTEDIRWPPDGGGWEEKHVKGNIHSPSHSHVHEMRDEGSSEIATASTIDMPNETGNRSFGSDRRRQEAPRTK